MEIHGKNIELRKNLSELDKFAIDFITILKRHSKYVLVSGYVAILLGRTRGSEDIDVIIPEQSEEEFSILVEDILSNGFYCLNAETPKSMYEYLTEHLAIRFAKHDSVVPNMELKYARSKIDETALANNMTVILGKTKLKISCLELQIAYKERVLKSQKDLEDARHLRKVAKDHLDPVKIVTYEGMIDEFYE